MFVTKGDSMVFVSPLGGTIVGWQVGANQLLYPQQVVQVGKSLKLRGRSHFCFPWFGPAATPSHGFLRAQYLSPIAGGVRKHRVTFHLEPDHSFARTFPWNYEGHLEIEAYPRGLVHKITLTNTTSAEASREIGGLPYVIAAHPYFCCLHGAKVVIGKKEIEVTKELCDPVEVPLSTNIRVHLYEIGTVTMQLEGVLASAECIYVWTDRADAYVCVEPVSDRPENYEKIQGMFIDRGRTIQAAYQITFEPE